MNTLYGNKSFRSSLPWGVSLPKYSSSAEAAAGPEPQAAERQEPDRRCLWKCGVALPGLTQPIPEIISLFLCSRKTFLNISVNNEESLLVQRERQRRLHRQLLRSAAASSKCGTLGLTNQVHVCSLVSATCTVLGTFTTGILWPCPEPAKTTSGLGSKHSP